MLLTNKRPITCVFFDKHIGSRSGPTPCKTPTLYYRRHILLPLHSRYQINQSGLTLLEREGKIYMDTYLISRQHRQQQKCQNNHKKKIKIEGDLIQLYHLSQCMRFPVHEISNNVVCATSKGSDQPVHTCRLIRAFSGRLNIL